MNKAAYIVALILVFVALGVSIENKDSDTLNASHSVAPKPVIIIDAGHGGFDGGASTKGGRNEKDINLSVSLYLKDYLDLFGFETVLTRETDESLEDEGLNTIMQKKKSDIHNRMNLMEKYHNCVFLSIHQNSYPNEIYSGMQVFYSKNYSEISQSLAEKIQTETISLLQNNNNRKIKECGTSVYLIYNAKAPACLIECGFLSNEQEAALLQTEEYQKKIAYCIAIAVCDYYNFKD